MKTENNEENEFEESIDKILDILAMSIKSKDEQLARNEAYINKLSEQLDIAYGHLTSQTEMLRAKDKQISDFIKIFEGSFTGKFDRVKLPFERSIR